MTLWNKIVFPVGFAERKMYVKYKPFIKNLSNIA